MAQRQGNRLVVRSQVFARESSTGIVSTEAMRSYLRDLRAIYPFPQTTDEETHQALPDPAFAFGSIQAA